MNAIVGHRVCCMGPVLRLRLLCVMIHNAIAAAAVTAGWPAGHQGFNQQLPCSNAVACCCVAILFKKLLNSSGL